MKNQGFTLIEVLIVTSLISFIFITLSYLAVNSIQNSKIGSHKILATHYGEELREVLRSYKEDDWSGFVASIQIYPNTSTVCYGPINLNGSALTETCSDLTCSNKCIRSQFVVGTVPDAIFKRYVTLSYHPANTSPTDPDPSKRNQLDVDITVEWKEGGRTFTVPLNTVFAQNE